MMLFKTLNSSVIIHQLRKKCPRINMLFLLKCKYYTYYCHNSAENSQIYSNVT